MNSILPTIGPLTSSEKNLRYILKYTDTVRINGSHNTLIWHKNLCDKIKRNYPNKKILLDLPGIKPRTNNSEDINIKKNDIIIFFFKKKPSKYINFLSIELTNPIPKLNKIPNKLSISDGQYDFVIKEITPNYIKVKSLQTFVLKPKKGVNIQNSIYDENKQINLYIDFLKKFKKVKFDAIGLSFVQSGEIINKIKKQFPKYIVIAKIENIIGVKNVNNICKAADSIMIDRGDLSAEIGEINLFKEIVNISNKTKENGKPLIMATENLDSMLTKTRPTKSEIVSISHTLDLGADKIMLSDETATSENWKYIYKWLYKFTDNNNKKLTNDKKILSNNDIFWSLISNVNKIPFVVFTKKGFALEKIFQISNSNNTHIFTDNSKVECISKFYKNSNVITLNNIPSKSLSTFIYKTIKNYSGLIFKNHHKAILIHVNFPRRKSRANSLTIISKEDFI